MKKIPNKVSPNKLGIINWMENNVGSWSWEGGTPLKGNFTGSQMELSPSLCVCWGNCGGNREGRGKQRAWGKAHVWVQIHSTIKIVSSKMNEYIVLLQNVQQDKMHSFIFEGTNCSQQYTAKIKFLCLLEQFTPQSGMRPKSRKHEYCGNWILIGL